MRSTRSGRRRRPIPGFAMAYWGEALAYNQPLWLNENLDKARAVLARLAPTPRRRRPGTRRRPRARRAISTRSSGCSATATSARATAPTPIAWRSCTPQFPDDDEAAAFYALALLSTIPAGERNLPVSLKAGDIALAILKNNPEHPGAEPLRAARLRRWRARGAGAGRRRRPTRGSRRRRATRGTCRRTCSCRSGCGTRRSPRTKSAFAASVAIAKRKGLPASQYRLPRAVVAALRVSAAGTVRQGAGGDARGASERIAAVRRAQVLRSCQPDPRTISTRAKLARATATTSLKSELASMKARLVVESGDWAPMKGQGSFDNIDELFALGMASVPLRRSRARRGGARAADQRGEDDPGSRRARGRGDHGGGARRADQAGPQRSRRRAGRARPRRALEAERPRPVARPYPIKPAGELYARDPARHRRRRGRGRRSSRRRWRARPAAPQSLLGLARAASVAGPQRGGRQGARRISWPRGTWPTRTARS